jgi:hypothetical protein
MRKRKWLIVGKWLCEKDANNNYGRPLSSMQVKLNLQLSIIPRHIFTCHVQISNNWQRQFYLDVKLIERTHDREKGSTVHLLA